MHREVSNLHKVKQLVSDKVRVWAQAVWLEFLLLFHLLFPSQKSLEVELRDDKKGLPSLLKQKALMVISYWAHKHEVI